MKHDPCRNIDRIYLTPKNCMCSLRTAQHALCPEAAAAWNMLNRVGDELGFPLVTRIRGGATGSGSVLAEKGKALMDAYDHFSEHLNKEARNLYSQIFELIFNLN